jgi:hypothetical protein
MVALFTGTDTVKLIKNSSRQDKLRKHINQRILKIMER